MLTGGDHGVLADISLEHWERFLAAQQTAVDTSRIGEDQT
jgi:hypothetical protein